MSDRTNYEPPSSAEELIRRYAQGERYFGHSDLPDRTNLTGVQLEGSNLERSWFHSANFSRANLRGVNFSECNVKCVDFSDADLEGANFAGAAVESLLLDGANLKGVNFAGASAYGYELREGQTP